MSDWKKSVFPTLAVIGAIAAFIGGSNVRTRQDTGREARAIPQTYLAGIEASADNPRKISEGEMFYQLLLLLERDYVDPNIDEQKLAFGAIKGAVGGLWDPLSRYLQKDHFEEQKRRLNGVFGGAGVELRVVTDPADLRRARQGDRSGDPLMLLPVLEVAMVAPGGPADKAGVKVGDRISGLNGKWLLGYIDVAKIRDMQKAVTSGKVTAEAFRTVRAEFQKKAKAAISIARAEDLLEIGEGKTIELRWLHEGQEASATLTTASTTVPKVVKAQGGAVQLRLFTGAARDLAVLGLGTGALTLDLTQSTLGDPNEIKPLLEILAPAGKFGKIVTEKAGEPRSLVTTSGATSGRHFRILADRSTRGAAEILASALRARGLAEIVGGPMAGEPVWVETDALADGTGYTLNTGRFEADAVEARK